jgi:diguanylate cyclase (GGDEF)-like protein/PAS domain S-box-containing protein
VQRCSRQLEEMLGYEPGELLGRSAEAHARLAARRSTTWGGPATPSMAQGDAYTEERQLRRKDGRLIWCKVVGRAVDPAQPQEGSIWIYDDISAERAAREELERMVAERTAELREAREHAQHLADHDALTGLPNRRLLEDRLTQALALSQRNRKQTAVMFVDLDRFKAINDSLGHTVGDAVLKEVASRLVKQLRVGDTVCRIGGDEFVVVLPESKRSTDAANVAAKILETLSQPVQVADRELAVTPSIGIAVFPEDGRDAAMLIRNADAAMYHAKESGRANYQFFTEQMNQAASRRLALEADLRGAAQKGELVLHYQPIAALAAGRWWAQEALLRWQHPQRGLVPPAEFVPLAEETGIILAIGEWALREACRWGTFIGVERGVEIAVNLSARQFNDPKLIELVRRVLAESGLPPQAARAGDHRVDRHAADRRHGEHAEEAEGARRVAGHRRFRHRLLEPRLPAPLPGGPAEDRPLVRRRRARRPQRRVADRRHRGARARARPDGDRRGRGDRGAARVRARLGCDLLQGYLIGRPLDADAASEGYV